MNEYEAREALAGIDAAQARLAGAMTCPLWRHAAFGAVMATMVGSAALPGAMQGAAMVVAMAATVALVQHYRKRMGVFVNGYRRGATLRVALALLGAMLVLLFAEVHLRTSGATTLSKIAIVMIAAGIATAASVVWQRVYVRDLTRGAA